MSIDLIPAPVEEFAAANPVLVNNLLFVGGVVLAGALIIGATRYGLRKAGVLNSKQMNSKTNDYSLAA